MKEEISWDCYFIHLAHSIKMKSLDPKIKKGGILASDDYKVKSTGYNDVPKEDYNELDWCNRDLLDYYLVSAEVNCILNADPLVEFETSTLYLTHSPSVYSIKTMAAAGIKKIIYDHCCGDIVLVRNICNYFMIEIIKFRPKDKVLIGSSTF
jgi:dCMP deaminase